MRSAHGLVGVPPPGNRLRGEVVHPRVWVLVCQGGQVAVAAVSGLRRQVRGSSARQLSLLCGAVRLSIESSVS